MDKKLMFAWLQAQAQKQQVTPTTLYSKRLGINEGIIGKINQITGINNVAGQAAGQAAGRALDKKLGEDGEEDGTEEPYKGSGKGSKGTWS